MAFDVFGARKEGYSDDEIAAHLAGTKKFDLPGALKEGYSATEVIDFLNSDATATKAPKVSGEELGRRGSIKNARPANLDVDERPLSDKYDEAARNIENVGDAFKRNLTFGISDKAEALKRASGYYDPKKFGQNLQENYASDIEDVKGEAARFKEANPIAYQLGATPGFLASMAIGGPVSTIGKAAATGARLGALGGLGEGDSIDPEEMLLNSVKGATIGGATGGTLVGGAQVAGPAIRWLGKTATGLAAPFSASGRERILDEYRNTLVGSPETRNKLIAALENAKTNVPGSLPTAAEAMSAIPEATGLAAHEAIIAKTPGVSGGFVTRAREQEAARAAALQGISKTPEDLASAILSRDSTTKPMREIALSNANIAGEKVPELTERIANRQSSVVSALQDTGRFQTTEGQQRARAVGQGYIKRDNAARAAEAERMAETAAEVTANRKSERDVAQYMLDSLEAYGLKPLKADSISEKIQSIASKPGLRASDVVTKSLGDVRNKINQSTDKNGVIDANDLYMIRKEIGNTVQKYAEETKNFDQRLTSGLQRDVQKFIDDAIESAGGSGWKKYLSKYAEMSKPIDEMKVGQILSDKLASPLEESERAAAFATAVKNAPATLKTSTGSSRYDDLGQVLSPENTASVNAVLEDLKRKAATDALAKGTNLPGGSALKEGSNLKLPNLLSRPAMIANYLLKTVGEGADVKINKLAAEQYLDPKKLAETLKKFRPKSPKDYAALKELVTRAAIKGTTDQKGVEE